MYTKSLNLGRKESTEVDLSWKQPMNNISLQIKKQNMLYYDKPLFTYEERNANVFDSAMKHDNNYIFNGANVETDNLYPHFRSFLIFGKLIGLLPFQGVFQRNVDLLSYKFRSTAGLVSMLIWIILGSTSAISAIFVFRSKVADAAQYATVPSGFIFYTLGCFIYVYFLKNSSELISICQRWNRMKVYYTKMDTRLTRHVNLMAGSILTSAILENITGQLRNIPVLFPVAADEKNMNTLEIYYKREQSPWAQLVPYNPILSFCLFLGNKFALYSWNFMDITITIFARAIYFKFKMLFITGYSDLLENGFKDTEKWRQLTQDYETLVFMLRDISNILSPLVFISYAANIYFVILHVHLGLMPSEKESVLNAVYAKWAFIHLIARLCMVSLVSAKINTWAHKCSELFSKCPTQAYIVEVERTDRFISLNTVGFTGLGCFYVTKPLLLQIVGVVFTFEIVLMQAAQTPLKA